MRVHVYVVPAAQYDSDEFSAEHACVFDPDHRVIVLEPDATGYADGSLHYCGTVDL